MTEMPWANTGDVKSLTGVDLDVDVLVQAQGVIELFAGVTENNTTDITAPNQRMLQAAVAYQAAWMHAQIDVATRTEVSQFDQDGSKFTPVGEDSLVLAPLARRALDRLSWRRKRALHTVNPRRRTYDSLDDYSDAWMRDRAGNGWRPL